MKNEEDDSNIKNSPTTQTVDSTQFSKFSCFYESANNVIQKIDSEIHIEEMKRVRNHFPLFSKIRKSFTTIIKTIEKIQKLQEKRQSLRCFDTMKTLEQFHNVSKEMISYIEAFGGKDLTVLAVQTHQSIHHILQPTVRKYKEFFYLAKYSLMGKGNIVKHLKMMNILGNHLSEDFIERKKFQLICEAIRLIHIINSKTLIYTISTKKKFLDLHCELKNAKLHMINFVHDEIGDETLTKLVNEVYDEIINTKIEVKENFTQEDTKEQLLEIKRKLSTLDECSISLDGVKGSFSKKAAKSIESNSLSESLANIHSKD